MEMTDKLTVGIDLGGTKIGAALVDSNGHDRAEIREQTLASEGAQAVERRLHVHVKPIQPVPSNGAFRTSLQILRNLQTETGRTRSASASRDKLIQNPVSSAARRISAGTITRLAESCPTNSISRYI